MLVLAALLALATSPIVTAPQPAQNRGNAAVTAAPSVLLGGASGQTDLCTGVESAGYGSSMLGVTFDVQHRDKACERIRKSKQLQNLADQFDHLNEHTRSLELLNGAVNVMCEDRSVKHALGGSCDASRVAVEPSSP